VQGRLRLAAIEAQAQGRRLALARLRRWAGGQQCKSHVTVAVAINSHSRQQKQQQQQKQQLPVSMLQTVPALLVDALVLARCHQPLVPRHILRVVRVELLLLLLLLLRTRRLALLAAALRSMICYKTTAGEGRVRDDMLQNHSG
jgi:hypothetical protein